MEYVLNSPLPDVYADDATAEDKAKYYRHVDDEHEVSCLLVAMMSTDLQKRFENHSSFFIMDQLKKMFQEQSKVERYNVTKAFLACKMAEGSSVSAHMLKMMSYAEQLERFGLPLDKSLAIDIVLNSLPASFSGFILNYHMHGMEKSLEELHGLLKTAESDMKKGVPHVLAVQRKGKRVKTCVNKRKFGFKRKPQVETSRKPK
ncbi:hypothetical protein QML37_29940, partial [Klebsiella pneumoniae]|uniref:hypothetical protein n=1 Tax=Klebsiella pneumoniae TaxID=573 RepID=UPI003A80F823